MRKSGKRSLLTFAVLLSLVACGPSPSLEQEATPVQAKAPPASYNLRIVFRGLIGFVEDSGKIWALLVDAEYVPEQVTENDLPPGMYHELGGNMNPRPAKWLAILRKRVPPHSATIRFSNAKVSGCGAKCGPPPNWPRGISGADLRLEKGNPGTGTIDLDALATACTIIKARDEGLLIENLAGLDQLDTSLLNRLTPASPSLDRRLAARVEVEIGKGDTVSANLVPDSANLLPERRNDTALYYFNRPSETPGCFGKHALPLAEEVVVTRTGVTVPVTLRFGPGDEITVEPDGSGKDVEINILNQTEMTGLHPHSHRWLYRLLDSAGQRMVQNHFYPCRSGNLGPPDCPQKRLFIAAKRSCR